MAIGAIEITALKKMAILLPGPSTLENGIILLIVAFFILFLYKLICGSDRWLIKSPGLIWKKARV